MTQTKTKQQKRITDGQNSALWVVWSLAKEAAPDIRKKAQAILDDKNHPRAVRFVRSLGYKWNGRSYRLPR